MINPVPDILARIVEHKRKELAQAISSREEQERLGEEMKGQRRDFVAALRTGRPAIISEIKKASPSKGLLAAEFRPAQLAESYEKGGASALSVLTDEKFFQGSLAHLRAARGAVKIPALRKDFTIDEFHVAEAAANGADAILLIVAILPASRLRALREFAARFRMAALVEVHEEDELDVALDSGAEIIGVNNRNLRTFEVTLDTSLRLAGRIPDGIFKVSESGIESAEDIRRLRDAGFGAFLIGEHLMKSADPVKALQALTA